MSASPSSFIHLSQGPLSLALCPAAGGSIASFRLEKDGAPFDLLRPYDASLPAHPLNMASFPLTPYSNRIVNCRMAFEGETFDVGPAFRDEPHQLHGDGWQRPWDVTAQSPASATLALSPQANAHSPYVYAAEQVFTLGERRLDIRLTVTNLSGRRLPFGLGHHPYFNRNDATVFQAHLPYVWMNDRLMPRALAPVPPAWDFSRGVAMADAHFGPPDQGFKGEDLLDHCFTGWDGVADIRWPDAGIGLRMRADAACKYFVIYVPSAQPFFCAEAVTNINDGFNLAAQGVEDTGIAPLAHGESLSCETSFEVVD